MERVQVEAVLSQQSTYRSSEASKHKDSLSEKQDYHSVLRIR